MDFPARYEPLAPLGEGGGGQVFAVTDRITGQRIALKILPMVASGFEAGALVREATLLHQLAEDPSLLLPKVSSTTKPPMWSTDLDKRKGCSST